MVLSSRVVCYCYLLLPPSGVAHPDLLCLPDPMACRARKKEKGQGTVEEIKYHDGCRIVRRTFVDFVVRFINFV
jgi:hypothetical protein